MYHSLVALCNPSQFELSVVILRNFTSQETVSSFHESFSHHRQEVDNTSGKVVLQQIIHTVLANFFLRDIPAKPSSMTDLVHNCFMPSLALTSHHLLPRHLRARFGENNTLDFNPPLGRQMKQSFSTSSKGIELKTHSAFNYNLFDFSPSARKT